MNESTNPEAISFKRESLDPHGFDFHNRYIDKAREGEFPLDTLTIEIREIAKAKAEKYGYMPEYITMALLSALASAVGNRATLEIRPDWVVNPAMMMVLVGRPGMGKTPPLMHAYRGLRNIDNLRFQQWQAKHDEWEAKKKAAKGELREKAPKLEQTVISDFTQEAMVAQLEDPSRGVAIVVDEIVGFFGTINRYNASNMIENLMSSFSGEQIKVSRKGEDGQGKLVVVPNPSINLIGTIQPTLFNSLMTRNYRDSGFLDRMMIVYPPTRPIDMWGTETQSNSLWDKADADWERLITLAEERGRQPFPTVRLSARARSWFYSWRNELMTMVNELDPLEVESRVMKRVQITAKIALAIHQARIPSLPDWAVGEISLGEIMGAVAVNEWLEWSMRQLVFDLKEQAGVIIPPNPKMRESWKFIDHLPREFTFAQVEAAAKKAGKCRSWGYLRLNQMLDAKVVVKADHGRYLKVSQENPR